MPEPRRKEFADELAGAFARLAAPVLRVLSPHPRRDGFWNAVHLLTGEPLLAFPAAANPLAAERYPGVHVGTDAATGRRIYAADDGGTQTVLNVVTNVCDVKQSIYGYDVVTGITVEKRLTTLRGVAGADPTCEDDPNDCCPCGPCGECDVIPRVLHMTVSGVASMPLGSDSLCDHPQCPQINGCYNLECVSGCTWTSNPFPLADCNDDEFGNPVYEDYYWTFRYNPGATVGEKWTLFLLRVSDEVDITDYVGDERTINCMGDPLITMNFVQSQVGEFYTDTNCTGIPPSIVIRPGSC